jgi:putative photosynthetic complex assembly protein
VRELEPGTNGFIRATLRGLARLRRIGDLGPEQPFRVTRWSDGRLTLVDMATGRVVDLPAFGQAQVEAFQSLLDAGGNRQ